MFLCLAMPQARGMHRSVNLVEGEELQLHCEPWGNPKPNVSWTRDSGPLNYSDPRIRLSDNNESLTIESTVKEDRDYYYCIVTSFINETEFQGNKSTLVRVKGVFIYSLCHH